MEKILYFVIFVPQTGEVEPAYSILTKEHLDEAVQQGIVSKSHVIPYKEVYSKEDVKQYLSQFLG